MLRVKQKLADGLSVTMVLVNYPSAALVEQVAHLGFDIAFIDTEKGAATAERIEEMCRGARAAGIAAVVRPWSSDAGLISRTLDLGADGVMVAAIDEPEAARALVEAVRYARWKDYDDKLVIAMIESPRAIDNLPAVLAVDGIDVWFIGPNDLAHRMGYLRAVPTAPKYAARCRTRFARSRRRGGWPAHWRCPIPWPRCRRPVRACC